MRARRVGVHQVHSEFAYNAHDISHGENVPFAAHHDPAKGKARFQAATFQFRIRLADHKLAAAVALNFLSQEKNLPFPAPPGLRGVQMQDEKRFAR